MPSDLERLLDGAVDGTEEAPDLRPMVAEGRRRTRRRRLSAAAGALGILAALVVAGAALVPRPAFELRPGGPAPAASPAAPPPAGATPQTSSPASPAPSPDPVAAARERGAELEAVADPANTPALFDARAPLASAWRRAAGVDFEPLRWADVGPYIDDALPWNVGDLHLWLEVGGQLPRLGPGAEPPPVVAARRAPPRRPQPEPPPGSDAPKSGHPPEYVVIDSSDGGEQHVTVTGCMAEVTATLYGVDVVTYERTVAALPTAPDVVRRAAADPAVAAATAVWSACHAEGGRSVAEPPDLGESVAEVLGTVIGGDGDPGAVRAAAEPIVAADAACRERSGLTRVFAERFVAEADEALAAAAEAVARYRTMIEHAQQVAARG